ncbi:ABC transporter ATP-binding protein [uncultured Tessaracoccus sp.]|uniref:ABC transporter ATP-binding protein n=1 Tax=uncultured Tessaracoccus sp. TaxID=905023 RepID=UPI0025D3F30D|nr:ATP-binding cassette domain-containing protein [uncultured Tessaracoccus sp.]
MATLEMKNVTKQYKVRGKGAFLALDDVSLELRSGQTIALVGQSGSGKSTIAKILMRLEHQTSGEVTFEGERTPRRGRALRAYRQRVRMVFQDPFASLNPYRSIRQHLERPLILSGQPAKRADVLRLLEEVQLDAEQLIDRLPHELSGGQRQRIAIARALATRPQLLIADEPVSMLDVSVRLGVLNLIADLQHQHGLGVLYITHDLATARHFSDEILVLNHGTVVERGLADDVILHPRDPYTRALRDASPDPERHFREREGAKRCDS